MNDYGGSSDVGATGRETCAYVKPVFDPLTKQALVAKSRSGVSIIEKAEFVKKLIEFVQTQINSYRISKPK